MGTAKKIISGIVAVLGIFGAFSAAMFKWGDKVIASYCEIPAFPFLGKDLSASPYCDLIVGFSHALFFTIIFVGILALVGFIWSNAKKIPNWVKEPRKKNLHLLRGKWHRDIYTLKFISTEWRYPFRKNEGFVSIPMPSLAFGYTLTWREGNITKPIQIRRWKFYEIDFLQMTEKGIRVLTQAHPQRPWKQGEYVITLHIESHIFSKRERLATDRALYAIVNYKGSNQVSVKITGKKPKVIEISKWW